MLSFAQSSEIAQEEYQRFRQLMQQKQRVERARQIDAENNRMSRSLKDILNRDSAYSYRTMRQDDSALEQYRRNRAVERQRRHNLVQKKTLLPSFPKAKRKLRRLSRRSSKHRNNKHHKQQAGGGMSSHEFRNLYSVRSTDQLKDVAQLFNMTARPEPSPAQKLVQAKAAAAADVLRNRDPSQAKYRLSYIVPQHTNTAREFVEQVRQQRLSPKLANFTADQSAAVVAGHTIQHGHTSAALPHSSSSSSSSSLLLSSDLGREPLPSILVDTAKDGSIVISNANTPSFTTTAAAGPIADRQFPSSEISQALPPIDNRLEKIQSTTSSANTTTTVRGKTTKPPNHTLPALPLIDNKQPLPFDHSSNSAVYGDATLPTTVDVITIETNTAAGTKKLKTGSDEAATLLEELKRSIVAAERSKNHHPLMQMIRRASVAGLSHEQDVSRAVHLVKQLTTNYH